MMQSKMQNFRENNPDCPEHEPSGALDLAAEQERFNIDEFFLHLKNRGLEITSRQWRWLIGQIEPASEEQLKTISRHYGGIEVFAALDGERLLINQEKLAGMTKDQQIYVLSHELGHRVGEFLSHLRPEAWRTVWKALSPDTSKGEPALDKKEISFYVSYLDKQLKDQPEAETKILQETVAELVAQYLSSDGTFGSMVRQKLLQFPETSGSGQPDALADYRELADEIGAIEQYLNDFGLDETEQPMSPVISNPEEAAPKRQEEFFRHHPKLRRHYQIWQALDGAFHETDEQGVAKGLFEEMSQIKEDETTRNELELSQMWETFELAEFIHPPEPISFRQMPKMRAGWAAPTGQPRGFMSDFLNFWKIFA